MKKNYIYIAALAILTIAYIVVEMNSPPKLDWRKTFYHKHDRPFGTSAIAETLPDFFPEVKYLRNTFYELEDIDTADFNLMIVCSNFSPDDLDFEIISDWAYSGKTVLIAASDFGGDLADTFDIETEDFHIFGNEGLEIDIPDSLALSQVENWQQTYPLLTSHSGHYFKAFDTAQCNSQTLADRKRSTFLQVPWGEGQFLLSTTPEIYSNYYFLQNESHELIEKQFATMPEKPLYWNEYYQMGDVGIKSPLRYILAQEPLKWAYYLIIGGLLLFVIFEAKRKQRIIPVVEPPKNSSIEFTQTVGNLYFAQKNHRDLGRKKTAYFLDHIRRKYYISTQLIDDDFFGLLAKKSGRKKTEIKEIFKEIKGIDQSSFDEKALVDLNKKIEHFIQDKSWKQKTELN